MKYLFLSQIYMILSCVRGVILFTVAVWGEQCKNVTIPCSFNPGKGVVIHWTIASNQSQIVHRYFDGQDKLNAQDESYKGRTSLFLSELTNGNASLQLKDLQEGDENIYSCYVGTETESKEDKVKLNVADFRHSIEYALDHDRLSLKCHASHVYPSDTVTIEWYDVNINKIHQDFKTSSSCTSCNVKNKSYKCILRHSLVQSTWTGMWETKAYEQGRVACTCNFCKTANAKSSVRLYLRKNGTEVPVASENSSSLLISDTYLVRVQGKRGEYSLFLNTADDSGDYMCESRTSDRIIIAVTAINNTPTKETQREEKRERWSIGLSFVVLCFCMALFVYFSYCKTNKDKGCIQNKDDKEENSSAPMKDDDKESSRVPLKDDEESSDAPMKGDDSK
ncbi:HERV-H LTR-associating protein 2 isoform X2 [Pyxicephalus adspersus]|uniref:HERV-H LTR-associating protein 2 isoform X2 n=1 Tax=Pyxicephalus adspersus TaxID=30357 RepID=UPI003B59EF9A